MLYDCDLFLTVQREPENTLSCQSHHGSGLHSVLIAHIIHYFIT